MKHLGISGSIYQIETVNYNVVLCKLFWFNMQALCELLFYNFYIIGVLNFAVHPMKYLESDVIWCKGNVILHLCLNDQSEKPMKISLRKLSPEQGNYQKVLSSTLNSLILTSKRVHLTLFQPLVTK